MSKHLLTAAVLLLTNAAMAQSSSFAREQWADKPTLHPIDSRYKNESALILLDRRPVEFTEEGKDDIGEYRTIHRIIHVNDDKGIESFNKVYLGYSNNNEIVDMHARAILPNGSIREVRNEDIKDDQEENGAKYKIFAMEGLEKGSEVEFYYTVKRSVNFFGKETLQGAFPILDAGVEVICPTRLIFQLKAYNCNAEVITDSSHSPKTSFSIRLKDIPGSEKEKYAASEANLRRVEYRLSYNTANGNGQIRLYTWNILAQRIHANCETLNAKELNNIGSLIGANGWQSLPSDSRKIVAVESYLKSNFTTREDIDMENAGNIEWILKNKIATHRGLIRLYAGIFQKLNIPCQIVLTCNRDETAIDKSFENWNNTAEYLLFFPGTGKFLAPTLPAFRYPWINPYWGAEDAFFCQTTTIGNFTTAIAAIKNVPLEDISKSYERTEVALRLDPASDTVIADIKESLGGYNAVGFRAAWILSKPDDRREMVKEISKSITNSERIITSNVENADFESCADNKPIVFSATIHSESLLENAGKNLLLKIGETIGKQSEMYQEKPRQFPVQVAFPHTLERFIDLAIPAGYTIKNPDDLVIHTEFTAGGTTTMGFRSDYKIEGETLKVHVMETYSKTDYPLADYANFQKVINAAADFNKVALVLEKK